MRKGKKITASSLLTLLGVLCFGTILVTAAVIGGLTLASKNIVAAPLTLTTVALPVSNNTVWTNGMDGLAGVTYETGLHIAESSTWTGNYAITIAIDAATDLNITNSVTVTYNTHGMDDTWTTITPWVATSGTLSFILPSATATGSGYTNDYYFTIMVPFATSGVVISFTANTV